MNFFNGLNLKIIVWSILALLVAVSIILNKSPKEKKFDTKKLTTASLCIALSFVLSYIRIFKLPQGGSITLGSLIPIFIFAYIYGAKDGILVGAVYGVLQFIQEPYIVHWAQVLIDYPLAFGALGLAGLSKKSLPIGMVLGGFGRLFFHVISGVIFFASYAPEGQNVFVYSFIYNLTYLMPDLILCVVIAFIPQFKKAVKTLEARI
ncbi:energy-coupled thiamine transporter ThiT [Thermobrachium celere]|uniref:Substrate-specific component ThiT of thiamin ECF transporter n=1 Tax=Thermobrachium celere DSM 8682 TaxID=941824 RepID=R7RTH9_9CLOT|nr:energy-coupled thiamine transporter ThiT [Thermobrachium celere]CDF58573.1 Substrate-specific component ThiT of thiamin ECF transporter [Thermobrachium celere DSM 8682]